MAPFQHGNAAISTAPAHGRPFVLPGQGRIADIRIFDDLPSAEPTWRLLELDNAVRTPYQSFDLLAAWQRHVGAPSGVTPCIVVGYDDTGMPAFLWPFGRQQAGPLRMLSFLGGKHANFNFALWRRNIVEFITADDLRAVFDQVAAERRIDILNLQRQPQSWDDLNNPFMLLPHQPSPSSSLHLTITARGEEQIAQTLTSKMRGQLRSKNRHLKELPGYRYVHATTPDEIDRLLDAFFPLKAAHMKVQALPNVFAEPGQEAFLREACHIGVASGQPLIEIRALEGGGELLAVLGAINDGRYCSGMFNTYTLSEHARRSPGLVLFMKIIAEVADRGAQRFDLGVGEASYKTVFCKELDPLFDSFLPLTPLGRLAAVTASTGGHVKRRIKQSDVLSGWVKKLRQHFTKS